MNGGNCIQPSISITFEEIDYSSSSVEYFNVIDGSSNLIQKCVGNTDTNCGIWKTCLSSYNLVDINYFIPMFTTYTITITTSGGFNALCSSTTDNTFNVELTFTCSNGTLSPTNEPTTNPTASPSLLTNAYNGTYDISIYISNIIDPSDPSLLPSTAPSRSPTIQPTTDPTIQPTLDPTATTEVLSNSPTSPTKSPNGAPKILCGTRT